MEFRTYIPIPKSNIDIHHSTKMMLFGSCFSENIGRKLSENKFDVDINPFGILYNPLSISSAMQRLLQNRTFSEADLVFRDGLYHSFSHHGAFSHSHKDYCLKSIRSRFSAAASRIRQTDVFLITFGTAYVCSKRVKWWGTVISFHRRYLTGFVYRLTILLPNGRNLLPIYANSILQ
jgi:hypothetical protein